MPPIRNFCGVVANEFGWIEPLHMMRRDLPTMHCTGGPGDVLARRYRGGLAEQTLLPLGPVCTVGGFPGMITLQLPLPSPGPGCVVCREKFEQDLEKTGNGTPKSG